MRLTPLEPWIAAKIGCDPANLSRSQIEAYQLKKLRETLHWCRERSSFYRDQLSAYPDPISDLGEFATLPFTTPTDIRGGALRFVCVSQSDINRVVTLESSGTTGPPKRFYFTRADQELTIDFFQVGMSTFTEPGDRVLILLPCERAGSVGDLLAIALDRLGAYGIRHGPVRDISETMNVMLDEQANGMVGVPTQVLGLARSNAARSFQTPAIKHVLLTTDHVPDAIVQTLESAWGCIVYNHYGMTEMGLGGGVECEDRRGYHLREADLYVEIIDPNTGLPVEEGEAGEVVFTTLTRVGMPLIRYRTGDISRFIPGTCPCGTVLKTLECIRYRLDGRLSVSDGDYLTMSDLDEILFPVESVLNFTAALEKNCLRLHVWLTETPHDQIRSAICTALDAIPAVCSGQLEVVLTAEQGQAPPSRAKRAII